MIRVSILQNGPKNEFIIEMHREFSRGRSPKCQKGTPAKKTEFKRKIPQSLIVPVINGAAIYNTQHGMHGKNKIILFFSLPLANRPTTVLGEHKIKHTR